MAKMNAYGHREVARILIDRPLESGGVWREVWALRSDGAILVKSLKRTNADGTPDRVTNAAWGETYGKDAKRAALTPDKFVALMTRHAESRGWTVVDNDTVRAEKAASVEQGKATRAANSGPRMTDAECAQLAERADRAGIAARDAVTPTPMIVDEHANPLDDNSPVVRRDIVPSGPFGSAWVTLYGTGSFARWARKNGWRSAYGGGIQKYLTIASIERQEAYAGAYAQVLRDAGLRAYSGSRMD